MRLQDARVMGLQDAGGISHSAHPDQTTPEQYLKMQSDLDQLWLRRPFRPKT